MDQEQAYIGSLSYLKLLLLIGGFVLNLCALIVFCDVPKLLKSTINTLVRNLFVVHLLTVLILGPLVPFNCQAWTREFLPTIQIIPSAILHRVRTRSEMWIIRQRILHFAFPQVQGRHQTKSLIISPGALHLAFSFAFSEEHQSQASSSSCGLWRSIVL